MALHEHDENELVSMSNLSISNNGPAPLYPSIITQESGGERLIEVGSCKTYTPTADDTGYVLKFECVVANAETKQFVGQISTILTSRVIPAPSPSTRKLIPVNGVGYLDQEGRIQSAGSFTVLSYNILSDTSASSGVYSYCPSWALSWSYRRQNLLREIVGYRADVVCLQDVHTLIKGLEKSAGYAQIPMVVCGDFNSLPGSAVHSLLKGNLHPSHPDLLVDPLNILYPHTKFRNPLPLVSAYSPFARIGAGPGLEQHRRRMDTNTNEPLFTNFTRDFIGTQDYIFYTGDSLMVESLLELLDEDGLRKNTALPSPEWSSSHIALLAEFRCIPRTRR